MIKRTYYQEIVIKVTQLNRMFAMSYILLSLYSITFEAVSTNHHPGSRVARFRDVISIQN
jgi:hypothetical protein